MCLDILISNFDTNQIRNDKHTFLDILLVTSAATQNYDCKLLYCNNNNHRMYIMVYRVLRINEQQYLM